MFSQINTNKKEDNWSNYSAFVWGIADDENILSVIDYIKKIENFKKITLLVQSHRADRFKGLVDNIISIRGDIHIKNAGLLIRLLVQPVSVNFIPCVNDYNAYYAVAPSINFIFTFKRRALITLFKDGYAVKIPIKSQLCRPIFLYSLILCLFVALIIPMGKLLIIGFFTFILLFYFVDRLFESYLNKFHKYLYNLTFKRVEMPYVSHGWMHPFAEKFYNKLVFSREGPINSFYDINYDYFPVYNPPKGKDRLIYNFSFINTHNLSLDKPNRSIFVIGGSVAQGLIANKFSYHSFLESKLKASGYNLKVIPWAIGGYQSTQERILVECSLIDRKPFAIVSLDFYNDVFFTLLGIPPGDTQRSQKKFLSEISSEYCLLSLVFDYSMIARYLWQKEYERIMERHLRNLLNSPEKLRIAIHNAVSIFIENSLRIHRLCSNEGIRHLTFIQPFRDDLENGSKTDNPKPIMINMCYRTLSEYLNTIDRHSEVFVKKPIFDNQLFSDEVHFTEIGQEKIAEHIFREIKDQFLMNVG